MPRRIQRRRTAGWRMPTGAIYVGRPGPWGNPYVPGQPTTEHRQAAVDAYRRHLAEHYNLAERARTELAGRDLACWCPEGQPCHADVLLEVANPAAGYDPDADPQDHGRPTVTLQPAAAYL